jgi:hypothetical protein
MALAQSMMPEASSLTRLVVEIGACAVVYFAVMGVLYPALSRQAADTLRDRLVRRAA